MASPSTSLSTLRPDLGGSFEEFQLATLREGLIATRVLPVFESTKGSGTFGRITIESLLQSRNVDRAPGGGYSRANWQFTKDTFATVDRGAEERVDDEEARLYAEYFDAELMAADRARAAVLLAQEQRAAALLFNGTTWTGSALTGAAAVEWDTWATSTPIVDVDLAVKAIWANSGLRANALILNWEARRNLANSDEIIDRIKYSGLQDPNQGAITDRALAQALGIEQLIVAGSPKNTAEEGQAAVVGHNWSNEYVMVARVAMSADIREPCVGRTIHWAEDGSQIGGLVESYRDEAARSDIVRVRHQVMEKRLHTEAAFLISNIHT